MNIGSVAKSNPKSVPLSKGFLESIPLLTSEERSVLASLTAESPAALWALIDASPDYFIRMLGLARTRQLSGALWHVIPATERQILGAAPFTPPPPGVPMVNPGPVTLQEPRYDVAKRDQLHRELKNLKGQDSPDAKRSAAYLERELRALLSSDSTRW